MSGFSPKRIFVACALTPGSRLAWRQALELGRRLGASVEGVHILEWMTPEGVLVPEMLTATSRRRLKAPA